jgi:hypothetical protein
VGEAWQSMFLCWGMPHVPKVSMMGQSNDYFYNNNNNNNNNI